MINLFGKRKKKSPFEQTLRGSCSACGYKWKKVSESFHHTGCPKCGSSDCQITIGA